MNPEINQKIAVRLPDDRQELYSRIENVDGDERVLIALPTDGVTVHTLAIGRRVALEWITGRGVASLPGVVTERTSDRKVQMLAIERTGPTELVQRRDYVRAEAFVPVTFTPARENAAPCRGTTLDVSGGGVRAHIAYPGTVGDLVTVEIELPEGPVGADGRVARRPTEETVAVQFTGIEQHERERLIRFVFAAHRRAALAARETA